MFLIRCRTLLLILLAHPSEAPAKPTWLDLFFFINDAKLHATPVSSSKINCMGFEHRIAELETGLKKLTIPKILSCPKTAKKKP